uniref:G-protein coupled receptors family 1 profile domain-containing protein n=1 Tax=Meloidogyne incognita TaxID=6306 RepID=A0A914L0C9_MELIC
MLKFSRSTRLIPILLILLFSLIINFNLFFVLEYKNNNQNFKNNLTTKISTNKCIYNNHLPFAKPFFLLPRIILTFLIPLIVVLSCNFGIIMKMRKLNISGGNEAKPTKKENGNKILFILIPFFYVLLNLPYNLNLALINFWNENFGSLTINLIVLWIFFLNYAIDFVIYPLASLHFRNSFYRIWIQPIFSKKPSRIVSNISEESVNTKI